MQDPIRTKHGDSIHVIPLNDVGFAALGSNKIYDSIEILQRSFSRSVKFSDGLYDDVIEIDGGFKARLIDNPELVVYHFKDVPAADIHNMICNENGLALNEDFADYLDLDVEEVLVAVNPSEEGVQVALTRVIGGMHHSKLIEFLAVN